MATREPGDQRLADLRPDQARFHADRDLLRIEDVTLRIGDGISGQLLALLSLRRGRAVTLTRRIHKLFCALAAARRARRDAGGWLRLQDIAPLEGWAGDTAKRIANELELGPGEIGIIESRGKGGVTQLRLRMPSELVSVGHLPDDVQARFEEPAQDVPIEEVRPQPVRDLKLANAVSEALRGSRLLPSGDESGSTDGDDRTLLVSPLYQGGSRSLVFGGLAVRPADSAVDEPVAASVLVKVAIGLSANRLSPHKEALDAECALLGDRAGWPGLPVWVERRQIAPQPLLERIAELGLQFEPQPLPVMIIGAGSPRTVEATPRLLRSVLDDTIAPMRRRTRRDLHNVMILAEQLATLTRLMHINRRAHRHLSTHAIVVRYEVGILEHVLAADLAASVPVRSDTDDLLYRDLFDLGAVLVHAITAVPLTGDRQDFQPPGFPGRALIKRAVEGEGETVLRLLFAIGRHLLEASPAASSAGRAAPTVRLLDDFLDELAHITMLHWSRARGVPERRAPWSTGGAVAASAAQHDGLARSAADPVATRLVTISHLVSLDTLHGWCLRYVTNWWRESIESIESPEAPVGGTGEPLAADRCITILRRGYGRSAQAEMWRYLWNSRDRQPDHLVRVVRNYVTLWFREGRFDVAHELGAERSGGLADELDRLATRFTEQLAAPDDRKRVVGWIDELRRTISDRPDGERTAPGTVKDPRLQSWMHATALRQRLRTEQRPPTEKDIHEIETAMRGSNSPETVVWHILLARAWVAAAIHGPIKADQESGWDKAMRTLLVAAGVAAAHQLPFEMVGTLSAAAHLARLALDTPRLRAELTAQGADEDSVRVQAAECALVAADGYLWLDHQVRHCRSVLEAAWLLRGSPFPERLIQAFQLLSLARNNRLLDWHPPQFDDAPGPERSPDHRFVRYPATAVDSARFTALERQLSAQTHEAWARTRGRIQPSDDPGTALEHGWFSRYSSSIQSIFGPGGPRIELAQTEDTRPGGRPSDRAVRRLLELAAAHYLGTRGPTDPPGAEPRDPPGLGGRIMDFGCGAGDEAWDLARDHTVWAVDSPVWFAAAPSGEREVPAGRSRPTFFEFHPVDYAQRILDGEPPAGSPREVDVVLFRCSLCRVSRRHKLLMAAHKLLRPGGFVLATDWIQTRTCDRITWSRLMNTIRLVGLETRAGTRQLSEQPGKSLRFSDFHAWDWQDVAGTDEPPMLRFFQDRLEDTRRELAAEDAARPRPPHARAALLQAQRDLEILTAMSTRSGPLGWLFWAARKPDAEPVVPRG